MSTQKFAYLKSQNADYIEELYQRYLENPDSVDETWRYLFEGIELGEKSALDSEDANEEVLPMGGAPNGHANGSNGVASAAKIAPLTVTAPAQVTQLPEAISGEAKVGELVQAYRRMGILLANLNPLEAPIQNHPALELNSFGLSNADLDRKFTAAKLVGFSGSATLREIIDRLRETYCGTIGVEFTHIQDSQQYSWLESHMESCRNKPQLSKDVKIRILEKLTHAEAFERFLHTRYVAQKRFSCEGGDTFIPMIDFLANEAAELGATDIVMGMAHRGRLNTLTNIFGKKYESIFAEFEGNVKVSVNGNEGDVKYHMGYSSDMTTRSGKTIHLSLANNPSHLEFVNPVVVGVAFAKQYQKILKSKNRDQARYDAKKQVIPVQVHGDAAFAGQGVVYETLQLSQLDGYCTGGSIHIVINNQVGFTTSPKDSRSTRYSTDLAKMLETPVFHVNGDDPEAAVYAMHTALAYRQKYGRDVVIDLICYRKYGHNEGDEPSFTQPLMYKQIKDHPSPREVYAKKLKDEGTLTQDQTQSYVDQINERLNTSHISAKSAGPTPAEVSVFEGAWKGLRRAIDDDYVKSSVTSVDEKTLKSIGQKLGSIPQGFTVHPKLTRLLEQRVQQVEKGEGIDWGTGEALAFGSLACEGHMVRVSGQDCERGTFSHRHSVLNDFNTGHKHVPLNHLKEGQAPYVVHNSFLSETAVLAFEYGFSIADPNSLVIWEAQFGDFANGAQVIIDQFIASSEMKWQRMSGIVMLLPHGYEGQGPEHSSARLERFLQLCAKQNMQVCNLTTPAQIFHALRRQVKREYRKPLIVMSPKSLLRHPKAISKLTDFSNANFQEVIDDRTISSKPRRVIFCSGKIYYDLEAQKEEKGIKDIAIVRIEQLYPWPSHLVKKVFEKYGDAKEVIWVQEEPKNMGAWHFVRDYLSEALADAMAEVMTKSGSSMRLGYVGRADAAAPAVGSSKVHATEQKAIIEEALK